MNVMHTIASVRPETGGPARSVPGLCKGLLACGVDVHLRTGDPLSKCPEGIPGSRFTVEQEGALGLGRGDGAPPDLIHAHGIWQSYNHRVISCARRKKIPVIVAPRGMLEPWSLSTKKWKKRLAMAVYQRRDLKTAKALHATAESEAEQFRKLGFNQPIILVPNGVDLPAQMPERTHRADGKKTALFLSRIHPKKGLMELIEAWARIGLYKGLKCESSKVGSCDWHVEYAGPDYAGHLAAVKDKMRELGVAGDFTYLGNLNDTEKWVAYRRADLFILPTYSENFGIVVAEAMAAGVPVVTTTGTPWKVLVDEKCGWWIEPGVTPLAKALSECLSLNRQQLSAIGENGRKYVLKKLAWNVLAEKMTSAYRWLLEGDVCPENVDL